MTFLGFDQSVDHAGVAVVQPCNALHLHTADDGGARGSARLLFWEGEFERYVSQYQPAGVALEGYAFSAGKGAASRSHSIGEVGGLLKMVLWKRGVPLLIVPPTTLKKFVTGKGQGAKTVVAVALFKGWGVEGANDDETDAAVLGLMAEAAFGTPRKPLTVYQREALKASELVRPPVPVRLRSRIVQQVAKSA